MPVPREPGTTPAVLELERVSHAFVKRTGRVDVLRDISLSVRSEEFVTVVGPSGCGKSTILNLAVGLLRPSSGEIRFHGKPVTRIVDRIGYVTQKQTLLPWRTLRRNVEFILEIRGVSQASRARRAAELIEQVGLCGFENHYPHELSGGMRQRAVVIRSLANDPEALLLDEPYGALDAQTRGALQNQLMSLHADTRKTMVFVTHDLVEAVALADRVIVLSRSPATVRAEHVVAIPRPRDVFAIHNEPEFRRVYDVVKDQVLGYDSKAEADVA